MRQISPLEREYRQLKRRTAPQLWSRIEGNLKEHPERETGREWEEKEDRKGESRKGGRPYRRYEAAPGRAVFAAAASAAALILLAVASPWYSDLLSLGKRAQSAVELSEGFPAGAVAAETSAFAGESRQAEETTAAREAVGVTAADGASVKERGRTEGGLERAGVLSVSQLKLAEYESLTLPAGAVTAAEDSMYFSEELLGDTEFLCLGTVTDVSLEAGPSGYPSLLVYEFRVDSVCYSTGYTTGLTHIRVKSPIVGAAGGESRILYQLQVGSSYVLPLKASQEGWELIFPFAPQIQAVPGGGYLFHSGFMSLTDTGTFVVIGQQEGANDFYYDRMLFRDDDHFLSDIISLVAEQT